MPKVPVYNQPTVQAAPLRVGNSPMIESGLAKGLAVGSQFAQIVVNEYQKAQDEASTSQAQAALSQVASSDLDAQASYRVKEGKDAIGGTGSLLEERKKRAEQIAVNLKGAALKKFKAGLDRSEIGFKSTALNHETNEVMKFNKTTREGTYSSINQTSASDPLNTVLLSEQRAKHDAQLKDELDKTGLEGPEAAEAAAMLKVSRDTALHASVLGARLSKPGGAASAKQYFDEVKHEMAAPHRAKYQELIDADVRHDSVNMAVDSVWEMSGYNYSEKAALLRDEFKGDKEAETEALQSLRARDSEAKQVESESNGKIWDMRYGYSGNKPMSPAEIRKTAAWRDELTGEQRRHFEKEFLSDARAARAESRAAKADVSDEVSIGQHAAFYGFLERPEELASMTHAQIAAHTKDLGPELTKKLMAHNTNLKLGAGKLENVKIDMTEMKAYMDEYGLTVKGPKDDAGKARRGQFLDAYTETVQKARKDKGGHIGDVEEAKIAKSLLTKYRIREERWGPDKVEDKFAFEVDDPSKLDLEHPVSAQRRAVLYLKEQGLPINDKTVASATAELLKPKPKAPSRPSPILPNRGSAQ